MRDKFESTLTEIQRAAFYKLEDIASSVANDVQNRGIAIGLHIAKELQTFLNDPSNALQQANENYAPVRETEKYNII